MRRTYELKPSREMKPWPSLRNKPAVQLCSPLKPPVISKHYESNLKGSWSIVPQVFTFWVKSWFLEGETWGTECSWKLLHSTVWSWIIKALHNHVPRKMLFFLLNFLFIFSRKDYCLMVVLPSAGIRFHKRPRPPIVFN